MALTQVSSGLISSVANTAITGNIISSQITSVANTQVTGLITSGQIATVANTQVTGLITSGQIATVANTQVTGLMTASQIATVANTQVTGLGTMSIQNSGNVSITGGNVTTTGLTVSGNAVFNSTGYMVVPVGTTGQRPGTNTQGSLRYNSSTNTLEINNGTSFSGVGGSAPGSDIFLAINYGAL